MIYVDLLFVRETYFSAHVVSLCLYMYIPPCLTYRPAAAAVSGNIVYVIESYGGGKGTKVYYLYAMPVCPS